MLRRWLVMVILALLALALTGCPALMVGSLAYEGYEYEKTGTLPGMPSQTPLPSNEKSNSRATPSPNDIE
jgi:hypothetical protein